MIMSDLKNMAGKAALVTGAASGLGRATALKFADAGANLFLVDVNADGLAETKSHIKNDAVKVATHTANLTDPAACESTVAAAVSACGRLDALCNVAGIIKFANSHTMPMEDWQLTLAINLTAPFALSRAAIPHLLEANGAIVNVASSAAFIGEAYAAAYCASKAGLVNLTKAMAMEYMRKPIRINAVAPGGMMTNIAGNMSIPDGVDPELMSRYRPMRGLVDVEDVADLILMLASPAGRGYHGACLSIDAGITAG